MCSKQQLRNILQEMCVDAEFLKFHYESAERFTIDLICRVAANQNQKFYNEYFKEWIKRFGNFTSTSWIVRRSHPNLKRLAFRKSFVCHVSGFNKKKNVIHSRSNKDCGAKIDFKIKLINRNTIKNDKSLKKGLNLTVCIDFQHSHSVTELDSVFMEYFSHGHSAVSAMNYHELLLLSQGMVAWHNSSKNPTASHVWYLHSKKNWKSLDTCDIMTQKAKDVEASGGVITYRAEPDNIKVVITAFMKNVIVGFELDLIVVESMPIKDGVMTFFFMPSSAGALPLVCVLYDASSKLNEAFHLAKDLIGTVINRSFEPKVMMTNDLRAQNIALNKVFPNTSIYSSRSSLRENIWSTICSDDTKIDRMKRHDLMLLFHSILYASDNEQIEKHHQELEANTVITSSPLLKTYLTNICTNHQVYVLQNENTIVDTSLSIFKEFIITKFSNFNSVLMLDVLVNVLDRYWRMILQAVLQNKLVMGTYTKYLPKDKIVIDSESKLKVSENLYTMCKCCLPGRKCKTQMKISFRSDTLCCDCRTGRKGRLCDHLNALLGSMVINIQLSQDEVEFYTKWAGQYVCQEALKLEPTSQDIEYDQDQGPSENYEMLDDNVKEYNLIKEEIDDPLEVIACSDTEITEGEMDDKIDNGMDSDNEMIESDIIINEMNDNKLVSDRNSNIINNKVAYENAMKNLNNEFRRLNKLFKENPNKSNLNTMVRLSKELEKIRPVERFDLSNVLVEMNN